jgi:hypothetical protein
MKNKQLLIIAVCLILTGSFLTGIGLQRMISNVKIRNEYRDSQLKWKNELLIGAEEDEVRDMKNQMLAENMKYVSIEREIYVDSSDSEAEARISNGIQSSYSCKIKLLRDATGEIIYESGLIDPGFYIETIGLSGSLKKGYYPCTVIWSFYTDEEEFAGEAAWKVVVIIRD